MALKEMMEGLLKKGAFTTAEQAIDRLDDIAEYMTIPKTDYDEIVAVINEYFA